LIDAGHQEIVLTGIHVGHYGVETTRGKSGQPPFRLWHLFERLDRLPGDWRMRLSSVEAAEIHDDFISAAANCERLCPQFHPALQSGSDTVLRRMRRRYSARRFLEKLAAMRERLDEPTFTTDIIVGFPGETDDEHAATVETCRQAGFIKLHLFPFSPRTGTPAAASKERVPGDVVSRRMAELAAVERDNLAVAGNRMTGRTVRAMAESLVNGRTDCVVGHDERYFRIEFPGSVDDLGRLTSVRIRESAPEALLGERVES
jgi:threonylcarbamoyladenosine tRNA methylthiotransferase MtaB